MFTQFTPLDLLQHRPHFSPVPEVIAIGRIVNRSPGFARLWFEVAHKHIVEQTVLPISVYETRPYAYPMGLTSKTTTPRLFK